MDKAKAKEQVEEHVEEEVMAKVPPTVLAQELARDVDESYRAMARFSIGTPTSEVPFCLALPVMCGTVPSFHVLGA